jgi:hypothetical protein
MQSTKSVKISRKRAKLQVSGIVCGARAGFGVPDAITTLLRNRLARKNGLFGALAAVAACEGGGRTMLGNRR